MHDYGQQLAARPAPPGDCAYRMKSETKRILCDTELLQAREEGFARLETLYAGGLGENAFTLCGVDGGGAADVYKEPEKWVDEALDDLAGKADAIRDPATFRPLAISPNPYGVHFIDKFFDANVYELDGEANNWQAEYLDTPVGALEPPDWQSHPTWDICRRLAEAFVAADVPLPLYGLPTLSSALNIGLNLYGQALLLAMVADPEAARHDLRIITDVIAGMHRWYLGRIPLEQLQMVVPSGRTQPPGYGQICGCSNQLVSREQYAEFIAPLDDEVLSVYPNGGMIHLCGAHTQHIPVWREMKSLRAVQMNDRAAEDLAAHFEELRSDQILYVNPFDGMQVGRIIEITGGRRTVIVGDFKEPLPVRREV